LEVFTVPAHPREWINALAKRAQSSVLGELHRGRKESTMRMKSSNSGNDCRKVPANSAASLLMAVFLGCCLPVSVMAQSPVVGSGGVTTGRATISQSGNTTNVNQSTQAAAINWQSFSVGSNSVVNFNQPGSTSVTLNRVIGTESSVIEGVLNANGHVFLLNGNGILMTKGSSINTAGFVASALDISDDDFKKGNYVFKANGSTGSVVNLGTITAKDGGYVALLGNRVSNQGVIVATKGTVAMAAGDQVTLNFNGNSLVGVTVDKGALNALVENKQAIYADGGKVILTAKAADDLLTAQVNNSGLIQARTVDDLTGDIQLLADGGTVHVSGTLDASAPISGDGGHIETSGNKVEIADGAIITTAAANGTPGTWLIDPDGFTIASSGGDISGSTLSSELGYGNVIIASTDGSGSSGNLDVNDAVSWSANTSLTLKATNDINVNQSITATGANAGLSLNSGSNINVNDAILLSGANATLTMNYGGDYNILTPASYAGAVLNDNGIPVANTDTSEGVYGSITLPGSNASLTMNGNTYTLIHSMSQLDALDGYNAATGEGSASTVTGYYAIAQNLDASGTTYTNSPIESFSGTLAGLGHTINNLTINAPSANNIGLIGSATDSTLRDIGLTNVNITGAANVGALLGNGGTSDTGGFTVENAYSTGQVVGNDVVGGLIGTLSGGQKPATINYTYSTAAVTSLPDAVENATETTGGLIGTAYYASIDNSHATGNVTAVYGATGGLAGKVVGANEITYSTPLEFAIVNSYATGNVAVTTTSDYSSSAGGLIGNGLDTNVSYAFATGNVSGYDQVGGLIGTVTASLYHDTTNYASLNIYNTYATGNVSSIGDYLGSDLEGSATGGLIGAALGTNVTDSFATGNVTSTYVALGGIDPVTGTAYSTYINVGGLIGAYTVGTISNSYATGNVSAATEGEGEGAGGLVGGLNLGLLTGSYATGNVTGNNMVGGLVGMLYNGVYDYTGDIASVTNSTAYGNVTGVSDVGGVAGFVYDIGTLIDVAAYSNVKGTGDYVGGIAGYATGGMISGANAYGSVAGADYVGGILGNTGSANTTIEGSSSSGSVNSDVANFSVATQAASTMSGQTGNYDLTEAQDDAQTPRESTADQLDQNLVVNDNSNYSATIKTVIVDGVEYQISDDSANPQKKPEDNSQKKPEEKK
jgi:filamentous hemagglutinin family protein